MNLVRRSLKKIAFSLAEVLVVLSIIGIIADMTLPQLHSQVSAEVKDTRLKLMKARLNETMNQMQASELLTGYDTAESFANMFTKFFKVIKTCKGDALDGCFSPIIHNGDEEIDVTTLVTGPSIVSVEDAVYYPSSNVGLMLANGVTAILNYKNNCQWLSPVEITRDENSYSPSTACISMVYDLNGLKGPNKVGDDIQLLNAVLGSKFQCKDIRSVCVGYSDFVVSEPLNTCDEEVWENADCTSNYYAAAKAKCEAAGGRLPSVSEWVSVAEYMYGQSLTFNSSYGVPAATLTNPVGDDLSISINGGNYWAEGNYNEGSYYAGTTMYANGFSFNSSILFKNLFYKDASFPQLRCVK